MNPCVRLARCIVTVAVISHLTQPAAYTGQCVGLGWAWGVRGGLGNGGTAGLRGGRRHGAVLGAAWCWSACVKCHQLCSDTWCLHINYFGNRNHNSSFKCWQQNHLFTAILNCLEKKQMKSYPNKNAYIVLVLLFLSPQENFCPVKFCQETFFAGNSFAGLKKQR